MSDLWEYITKNPEVAIAVGTGALALATVILAAITWVTSAAQRRHEARQRRDERRWERLNDAALHLRLSSQRAAETRSWDLDPTSWSVVVAPFIEEAIRAAAALALVRDQLDSTALDRFNEAVNGLYTPELHDGDYMAVAAPKYTRAASRLLEEVETLARRLAH